MKIDSRLLTESFCNLPSFSSLQRPVSMQFASEYCLTPNIFGVFWTQASLLMRHFIFHRSLSSPEIASEIGVSSVTKRASLSPDSSICSSFSGVSVGATGAWWCCFLGRLLFPDFKVVGLPGPYLSVFLFQFDSSCIQVFLCCFRVVLRFRL